MLPVRELKAHYLRIYKKADEILKQPDNPCQIKMDAEGKVSCTASRSGLREFNSPQLCCAGCKHLGPNGCTEEALWCKLGWCYVNRSSIEGMGMKDHHMFGEIKELRDEARALGVPLYFRSSFEESFR